MTGRRIARRALAAALFVATPVAADTATLVDAVRAAKVREAGLRSIEGSLDVLRQRLSDADALQQRLLATPQDYVDPELGRTRLAAAERQALQQEFRRQLEAFARNRDEGLPKGWADEVLRTEKQRVEDTIDALLQRDFETRYQSARAAAVRQQRDAAALQVAPEAASVVELAGDLDGFGRMSAEAAVERARSQGARDATAQRLARARAEGVWLAEVAVDLDATAQRATETALASLWEQLHTLQTAALPGLVRAADIGVGLQAELERVARASDSPLGVFAVARDRVEARAVAIEREKLAATITANLSPERDCVALPASTVQDAVGDDLTAIPADFVSHRDALTSQLLPPTRQRLVREYSARLQDVGAQPAFSNHIEQLVQADPSLAASLQSAFAACLEPPLAEQRRELARAELAAVLPTIADRSFELDDDALAGLLLADGVDPTNFPPPKGLRFDESRALYTEHIRALHEEAVAALRVQEGLTRAHERRQSFVRQVEDEPTRDRARREEFQRDYERSVLEAWRRRKARVLLRDAAGEPLHPDKYDRVFTNTAQIIDEIITIEFERPAPTATPQRTPSRPPTAVPTRPPPPKSEMPTPPPTLRPSPIPPLALPTARPPAPPLPQSGGGMDDNEGPAVGPQSGGGDPCVAAARACRAAADACHAAVIRCRDEPGACAEELARCGQAKFACEQVPR